MKFRSISAVKGALWLLLASWSQFEDAFAAPPTVHLAALKKGEGLRTAKPLSKPQHLEEVKRKRQLWTANKHAIQREAKSTQDRETALKRHRQSYPQYKHEPSSFDIIAPIGARIYRKAEWRPANAKARWDYFQAAWAQSNSIMEQCASNGNMDMDDWSKTVVHLDKLTTFLEGLSEQEHSQLNSHPENDMVNSKELLAMLEQVMTQMHQNAKLITHQQLKEVVTRLEVIEGQIQNHGLQSQQRDRLLKQLESEIASHDAMTMNRVYELSNRNYPRLAFEVKFQKLPSAERKKIIQFGNQFNELQKFLRDEPNRYQTIYLYQQLKNQAHSMAQDTRLLMNQHDEIDMKSVVHSLYKASYLSLRERLFKSTDLDQKKQLLWDLLLVMDEKWPEYQPIPIRQTDSWKKIRQSLIIGLHRSGLMFDPFKSLEETGDLPVGSIVRAAAEARGSFMVEYDEGQLQKQPFYWLSNCWTPDEQISRLGKTTPHTQEQMDDINIISGLAHGIYQYMRLKQRNADKILVELQRVSFLRSFGLSSEQGIKKWEGRLGLDLKKILNGLKKNNLVLNAQEIKRIQNLIQISQGEQAMRKNTFMMESSSMARLEEYKMMLQSQRGRQIHAMLNSMLGGDQASVLDPNMPKLEKFRLEKPRYARQAVNRLAEWKTMQKSQLQLEIALLPYSAQCMLAEDARFEELDIKLTDPMAKKLFSLGMRNPPYSVADIADLSKYKNYLESQTTRSPAQQKAYKYIKKSIAQSVDIKSMTGHELDTALVRADINKAVIKMFQDPRVSSSSFNIFSSAVERAKQLQLGLDKEEQQLLEMADIFNQPRRRLLPFQAQKIFMHNYFDMLRNRYEKSLLDQTAINHIVRLRVLEKYYKLKADGTHQQIFGSKAQYDKLVDQQRNNLSDQQPLIGQVKKRLQRQSVSLLSQFTLKMSDTLTGKQLLEDLKQFKQVKGHQLEEAMQSAMQSRNPLPQYNSLDVYQKLSRALIQSNGGKKGPNQLKAISEAIDAIKDLPLEQRRQLTERMFTQWIDVINCHEALQEKEGRPNDSVPKKNGSPMQWVGQMFRVTTKEDIGSLIHSIGQLPKDSVTLSWTSTGRLINIQEKMNKDQISPHSARMLTTMTMVADFLTDRNNLSLLKQLLSSLPSKTRVVIEQAFSIDIKDLAKAYQSTEQKDSTTGSAIDTVIYSYPTASRDILIMNSLIQKILGSSYPSMQDYGEILSGLPSMKWDDRSQVYQRRKNAESRRIWKLSNLCGIYQNQIGQSSEFIIRRATQVRTVIDDAEDDREMAYYIFGRDIIN